MPVFLSKDDGLQLTTSAEKTDLFLKMDESCPESKSNKTTN